MSALTAGYNAARRAWDDPGTAARVRAQHELRDHYAYLWSYYRNEAFDGGSAWASYADHYQLYRYTRLIYNPVPTIVTFYEDHIYPGLNDEGTGAFASDGGAQLVTPALDNTDDRLKSAIAQLDQWGNWQAEAPRMVRFGGATGNVLVEVVDDLEREKVTQRIVWPSWVHNLQLDMTGNVKAYTLEYEVWDALSDTYYRFRKEVNDETISYFRDDKPYDAGSGAVVDNPYGFVPAVWIKHIDDGNEYGYPAVWNLGKVDEINSLASHLHDNFHKQIEAAKVLSTDGEILSVTGASGSSVNGGVITPFDTRRDLMLLKTPAGASVHELGSTLDAAAADPTVDRALASFERDYPELQAQTIISTKTQLSGAALERMLAPSQAKLDRAAANYHQQVIKLRQMGVAIAGWRLASGAWRQRTEAQAAFAGFNLKSYADGQLNFGLKRSLLVQESADEREDLLTKKAARSVTLSGIVDKVEELMIAGYSKDRAEEIVKLREKEAPAVIPPTPPTNVTPTIDAGAIN